MLKSRLTIDYACSTDVCVCVLRVCDSDLNALIVLREALQHHLLCRNPLVLCRPGAVVEVVYLLGVV